MVRQGGTRGRRGKGEELREAEVGKRMEGRVDRSSSRHGQVCENNRVQV